MSLKAPARSPEVQTKEWTALEESLEANFGGIDKDETKVFLAVEAVLALESTPQERQKIAERMHALLFNVRTKVWPIANECTEAIRNFPRYLVYGKDLVQEALYRKWKREGFPQADTMESANQDPISGGTQAIKAQVEGTGI